MENSLHPSSSFFSPEQQAKLIAAIFSHRLEHSGFLYEGDGAEYWEKVSEDPSYKFLDVDLQLLCHSQNALAKYFDKESTITDVGAGNGSKAIALLGIGPDTGKEFKKKYFTYRPSDSSYAMTLLAKKNVREQTHNPHIMFGNSQIMEGGQLLTNYLSHNTYLRLGGTIGNFSDSQIIKFLKAMDNHGTLQGNQILLSYFTPPTTAEIEDLKSCYDNQTAKDFVFNGVKNLGLSPEHFDFQVQYVYDARETVWDGQDKRYPGEIQIGIVPKEDIYINNITAIKGEFYLIHASRRFSREKIQSLLASAGCKIKYEKSGAGLDLLLVEKQPSKLAQHKVKIRNVLFMTLALGTGILGKDVYDRYVQQEREEQAKLIQYEQPNYFVSAPATMQALQYFETMYRNSSSAHTVELQALLESTVVREITNGNIRLSLVSDMEIDWGEGGIYGFLLKFSRENAKLLAQWGVSIGKPYQHMLQHLPDLKKTLALQESEDVGKIIPKSQPPDPQYLPSLTYVIIRYGSDSPEFEKALQERREAIKAYDAWQKQHQGLQPLAFLWSYRHSNGDVYHLQKQKNGAIVASIGGNGRVSTAYTSDNAVRAFQDYLAYFWEGEKTDWFLYAHE